MQLIIILSFSIAAHTPEAALKAADLVQVEYEKHEPIVTMEQAIEAQSFHPIFGKKMETIKNTQDIHNELISCHTVIESMVRSGAQEHFYMESNCCLAGNYKVQRL